MSMLTLKSPVKAQAIAVKWSKEAVSSPRGQSFWIAIHTHCLHMIVIDKRAIENKNLILGDAVYQYWTF